LPTNRSRCSTDRRNRCYRIDGDHRCGQGFRQFFQLRGGRVAAIRCRQRDQFVVELRVYAHARGAQTTDQPAQCLFYLAPSLFLRLNFQERVAIFLFPIRRIGHEFSGLPVNMACKSADVP
jgi:hypothetical protein